MTLGTMFAVALSAAIATHAPTAADVVSTMPTSQEVEEYVREYFANDPVMIAIAQCESRFRQFDKDGNVLMNEAGSTAKGAFQVMSSIHEKDALELGFDINTLKGNVGFAEYLKEKQGTKPWNSSKKCWGSKANGDIALAK